MIPLTRHSHFAIRTLPALNHARAEEEKRGHIHWLRPEYQAKGQKSEDTGQKSAQPAEQPEFEGVAADTSSRPQTKDKGQQTFGEWPRQLPDQIRAVRSALETLSGPAVGKLFKGARKDRIEMLLETLQALGHAHEVDDGRYSA